ncbi:MAG: M15 family metallopeptidase [Symploca sp. SIO3C6]|uniref:D-alanyl-D-alanine dipeptidase n=1 Tax=Symploca sp. SIO1C4 TaxID=2607765 RepID=A0A6B3NFB3_9CYAN|nr:M15 family metallopeptidase [Symploca sp. SIO3C6]NER30337.1 M15 family metallopeptidase [Symploca sp. SIO1C4]NET03389.1 M15 family metallopeptidase [Symploca sp. SIO2B6]
MVHSSRWVRFVIVILLLILLLEFHNSENRLMATSKSPDQSVSSNSFFIKTQALVTSQLPYEARLIDIGSVNPNIILDIRYATENNFLHRKLYPVARCVLRGAAAKRLSQVQDYLETKGLGLKVFDCYRPLSVQRLMWEVLPDPRYVANPERGSRHNRGAAVDLTLVDSNGKELEMPTDYDDFTKQAHRDYNGASAEAMRNRQLLEEAMQRYGFIPLSTEWWHFDDPDWNKFSILDLSFEEIPFK